MPDSPLRALPAPGALLVPCVLLALLAPPEPARAQTALRLDGTCRKLVVAGQDLTGSCAGTLMNAVSRGRTTFDFASADGRTLRFGGSGAQQAATEETDPLQPISRVEIGGDAPIPAVGACRFSTPEPGRTSIACEARAGDGRTFAGTFVTAAKAASAPPSAPASAPAVEPPPPAR